MIYLPKLATISQACEWLSEKTGDQWILARLLECHLTPHFWLEYQDGYPTIYGDRREGYLTRMMFHGDMVRLEADGGDALVQMLTTHDGELIKVDPPMRVPVSELRFERPALERVAEILTKKSQPPEDAERPANSDAGPPWREAAVLYANQAAESLSLDTSRPKTWFAETVRKRFLQEGIRGPRGVLSKETILREALSTWTKPISHRKS